MLYFPRITPLNFLYAWWQSLRQPVGAWNMELPGSLGGRFQRLRPYLLFTHDEWLLLRVACFDAWKTAVLPELTRTYRCAWRYRNLDIDFSRNLWQVLGAEFERQFLFLASIRKKFPDAASRPQVMESWFGQIVGAPALHALFPDIEFRRSIPQRLLEALHEWAVSAAHVGRAVYQFMRSLAMPRMRLGVRTVVWQGISPQEIPDRDHRLNFAWAVQYGALPKEDVLYLLPCGTNAQQKAYLKGNGIAWAEPEQVFRLLPPAARLRALGCALRALMAGTLRSTATDTLLPRFAANAGFWSELADTLGIQRYVTTISQAWPEKPELAVMKTRGIKCINWAYSANSLQFATNQPGFRDVGVARSIVISDESWVWNPAYRAWLLKRQLEPSQSSTILVAGPLMCGNAGWMKPEAAAARVQLGLPREGVCIGVFDMPFVNERWRDRYGGGPGQFEFADYEAFCDGIRELLDRLPASFALVKPKRSFNDPYRSFPQVLHRLIDAGGEYVRRGRVFLVDENVDPYLPVSASDVAVGMPYTSPILAARAIGRPGAFYDPRKRASHASVPGLRELTIQSIEELIEFVGATVHGTSQRKQLADESITPPLPAFPQA
jgi:hypothetical protein